MPFYEHVFLIILVYKPQHHTTLCSSRNAVHALGKKSDRSSLYVDWASLFEKTLWMVFIVETGRAEI
jgi:hypothetical protein